MNELVIKLFNGTITGNEYNQLNTYMLRLMSSKYLNVKIEDIEDSIAIANSKLFNNDKFDSTKGVKEITYYTRTILNEINNIIKKRKVTSEFIYDDHNYLLSTDNEMQIDRTNEIEMYNYIKDNYDLLFDYLYTNVYISGNCTGMSYQYLSEKYNLSLSKIKNTIYQQKQKVLKHFTGKNNLNRYKKQKLNLYNERENN